MQVLVSVAVFFVFVIAILLVCIVKGEE